MLDKLFMLEELIFSDEDTGGSFLHDAARSGDVTACRKTADIYNEEVDTRDESGFTPLFLAAAYGHVEVVKYLLSCGANLGTLYTEDAYTLLHYLAFTLWREDDALDRRLAVIALCLQNGADTSLEDTHGMRPCELAPPKYKHSCIRGVSDRPRYELKNNYPGDTLHPENPFSSAESLFTSLQQEQSSLIELTDLDESNNTGHDVGSSLYKVRGDDVAKFVVSRIEQPTWDRLLHTSGPLCILVRSDWLSDFEEETLTALQHQIERVHVRQVHLCGLYGILQNTPNPIKQAHRIATERAKILERLSEGTIIIMTLDQHQDIPSDLKEFITVELAIPRFSYVSFRDACATFFPLHETWEIKPAAWHTFISPQDFMVTAANLKEDVTSNEIVQQIEQQTARRVAAHRPRRDAIKLSELHGMEAAKSWALDLTADIQLALTGAITWDKVDRGALLQGSPGVGKTALARAIAAELSIPLLATTATKWQSAGHLDAMLSAMTKDFQEASSMSPCILFIDELDAVGDRNRAGQHDQWVTWSVNHLLALMDGFSSNQKVIVLGATNHADKIDPALRRSGRLDRTITLPLPNRQALQSIYKFYLAKEKNTLSVSDIADIANASIGLTGADVERIVRDAYRIARRGDGTITQKELFLGLYETPPENQRQPLSQEDLKLVAYHEAGHAIMMLQDDNGAAIRYLSIVPRANGSLGFVAQSSADCKKTLTLRAAKKRLDIYLGGRAAEEIIFGKEDISSGASGDLHGATLLANNLVSVYGMGPSGSLSVFEVTKSTQNEQVEKLLQESYARTIATLEANRNLLDMVANALLEKSELSGADFSALVATHRQTVMR